MRTKAVLSKIAAVGTGLAFVGATFMGALAADLKDYPNMFLKDSKFNAAIVVGDTAVSSDVVGAIDLAASLQYAARTTRTVSVGGTTTVSASSGAEIIASGNHLTLGEALNAVKVNLKKENLPTLLADGTVKDESSNDNFKYTQKLAPSADIVKFGNADKDIFGKVPKIYLDQSTGEAYTLTVDFDTALNVSALDDNEKIKIAGTTWTFDPAVEQTDTSIVMYMSDKTESISVGDTKEITLADGTKITILVVGANSDKDSATLKINGKQESVLKGDSVTVGDTEIYINDVFTYNIPVNGAAVDLFVGSKKVTLDAGGAYADVDVDGDTLTGMTAKITGGVEALTQIDFKYTPSDNDDDQYKYLFIGESITDPLFESFNMNFGGMTPDMKDASKTRISLTRSGGDYKLSFKNKDGEAYAFDIFHSDSGSATVTRYEDFAGAATNITNGKYFILTEGTDITKVYKLTSVVTEDSVDYAKLKDLADNSELKLKVNDEIGDTGVKIADMNNNVDWITLNETSKLTITTEFDGAIAIRNDPDTNNTRWDMTFTEGTTNFDDLLAGSEQVFDINITGDSANGDQDITIGELDVATAGNWNTASDEDNYVQYGITKFGTYMEREKDNYGDYLDFYYPNEETSYHMFFTPVGATISTTPGGDTVTYYETNKINAAAKLAGEIADPTAQNLIVVGGPCANKVAYTLMGSPKDCTAGFQEGKAILKLIENGQNVALLVAGYSALDTRKATTVLSNYGNYALSGKEMVVTGTSLTEISVSAPTTQ